MRRLRGTRADQDRIVFTNPVNTTSHCSEGELTGQGCVHKPLANKMGYWSEDESEHVFTNPVNKIGHCELAGQGCVHKPLAKKWGIGVKMSPIMCSQILGKNDAALE